MHFTPIHRVLNLAAVACLASFASAQSNITTLVEQGDTIVGVGDVTSIIDSATNNYGSWLVEVDTDAAQFTDAVVLHNGAIYAQEGVANSGFDAPVGGTFYDVVQMEVSDHGEVMLALRVTRADQTNTTVIAIDGQTVFECDATPAPAGVPALFTTWSDVWAVWMNNNGQLLVSGALKDGPNGAERLRALARFDLDGFGGVTSQTALAFETELLAGHDAHVQLFGTSRSAAALNDAGSALWIVDDEDTTTSGVANGCCDTYLHIDGLPVIREGQPTGLGTDHWNSLHGSSFDMNDSGEWAGYFRTDHPSPGNKVLVKNGDTLLRRSGDPVPSSIAGTHTITELTGTVSVTKSGQVLWQCTWPGPGTALFRDNEVLLQKGVTTIDGDLVYGFNTNVDERSVSSDGTFITQELVVARAGGNKSGCYLISLSPVASTFCFGDGITGLCPCANYSLPGSEEGCMSSMGHGALLTAEGNADVSLDNLRFVVTQARPNQPSMLLQGNALIAPLPFKDGLLCLGNPTERVEVVRLNGDGGGTTSSSIVTNGHVNAGETRYYQQWFRDPGGVGPCGNGSNFSNGVQIDWI